MKFWLSRGEDIANIVRMQYHCGENGTSAVHLPYIGRLLYDDNRCTRAILFYIQFFISHRHRKAFRKAIPVVKKRIDRVLVYMRACVCGEIGVEHSKNTSWIRTYTIIYNVHARRFSDSHRVQCILIHYYRAIKYYTFGYKLQCIHT